MKTRQAYFSKTKIWRRIIDTPEIWQLVDLKSKNDLNTKVFAYAKEQAASFNGSSLFVWETSSNTGIEWKRSDAMKKAEQNVFP